jgi:alpha/beta hydrolase fold
MCIRAMRRSSSRSVALHDGRSLRVREWPGRGRPLVLLHGLLDSSAGWSDLGPASRRPCLAIDLPGFGQSSPPCRPRLSAYAEDVIDGLRELDVVPLGKGTGRWPAALRSVQTISGRFGLRERGHLRSPPDRRPATAAVCRRPPAQVRGTRSDRSGGRGWSLGASVLSSPRPVRRSGLGHVGRSRCPRSTLARQRGDGGAAAGAPPAQGGHGPPSASRASTRSGALVEAACDHRALDLSNEEPSGRRRSRSHVVDLARSRMSVAIGISSVMVYTITDTTQRQLTGVLRMTVDGECCTKPPPGYSTTRARTLQTKLALANTLTSRWRHEAHPSMPYSCALAPLLIKRQPPNVRMPASLIPAPDGDLD